MNFDEVVNQLFTCFLTWLLTLIKSFHFVKVHAKKFCLRTYNFLIFNCSQPFSTFSICPQNRKTAFCSYLEFQLNS
jgi:hypothetical protein